MDTPDNGQSYTPQSALQKLTVDELKVLADKFDIKVPSRLRKADIVKLIIDSVEARPERVVSCLPSYLLEYWLKVMDGKGSMDYSIMIHCFGLDSTPFVFVDSTYDNGQLKIQPKFLSRWTDMLRPVIEETLARRRATGVMTAETIIYGLTNISGYTTIEAVDNHIEAYRKKTGIALSDDVLIDVLFTMRYDDKYRIVSPFIEAAWFEINDTCIDPKYIGVFKEFDLKTIMDYGRMPLPLFKSKGTEALRKCFGRWGNDMFSADELLLKLFLCKQSKTGIDIQKTLELYFNLTSIDDINTCAGAITDFSNNIPFWRFGGYSSSEIFDRSARGGSPRIVPGPNLRTMGYETYADLVADGLAPDMPFGMAGYGMPLSPVGDKKKVGRNDPCPCGSGKKYKHCCGR